MYKEHPQLDKPNDSDTLWRFTGFAQLIDLFENRGICFTNICCFDDPFEGIITKYEYEEFKKFLARKGIPEDNLSFIEEIMELKKAGPTILNHFINCWHLSERESFAMWKIYAHNGLAIKTTFKKLCDSIIDTENDVAIGKVKYIDHEADKNNVEIEPTRFKTSILNTLFARPYWFEYENEVRAHTFRIITEDEISNKKLAKGVYVPVDPNVLIDEIVISPFATWTEDILKKTVEKYNINALISQSVTNKRTY